MTRDEWLDEFSRIGAFFENLMDISIEVSRTGDVFTFMVDDEDLEIQLEYDPDLEGEALMRKFGDKAKEVLDPFNAK